MASFRFSNLRDPWGMAQRLKQRPYSVLAGAVGLGFVLGGGLFTRLTARIVGIGLRAGVLAALPMMQKELIRRVLEGEPAEVSEDVSQAGT
jgi:hypothetical protein